MATTTCGEHCSQNKDIYIIDFEGETALTYSERRIKKTALKDVAGMVRYFHYAAYAQLFL
jgi:maltose alpha-D-glucosyltransferase/alpha-amylase